MRPRPKFASWSSATHMGVCVLASLAGLAAFGCVTDRGQVDKSLVAASPPAAAPATEIGAVTESYHPGCPTFSPWPSRAAPSSTAIIPSSPTAALTWGTTAACRIQGASLLEIGPLLAEQIGVATEHVRMRRCRVPQQACDSFRRGHRLATHGCLPGAGIGARLVAARRRHHLGGGAGTCLRRAAQARRRAARSLSRGPGRHRHSEGPAHQHARLAVRSRLRRRDAQARVEKCVPPWLRPAYQRLWNLLPAEEPSREKERPGSGWVGVRRDR